MTNTPYLLGRLAAALERLGVLTPNALYMAYEQPAQLSPLIARAIEKGADAEALLLPLIAQIPSDPNPFEQKLTSEQQSAFGLGYYHQRAAFRAGVLPTLPESEPELDARYEFRIDPDLKAWVKSNGGDKLIRALLRSARERTE